MHFKTHYQATASNKVQHTFAFCTSTFAKSHLRSKTPDNSYQSNVHFVWRLCCLVTFWRSKTGQKTQYSCCVEAMATLQLRKMAKWAKQLFANTCHSGTNLVCAPTRFYMLEMHRKVTSQGLPLLYPWGGNGHRHSPAFHTMHGPIGGPPQQTLCICSKHLVSVSVLVLRWPPVGTKP